MAPAWARRCSARVVLPPPAWPARTMLRRWAGSTVFIVIDGRTSRLLGCRMGRLRGAGGARLRRGRGPSGRGSAMIVGYTPARDVRTLKMIDDQAPEGRHGREARSPFHQG